MARTLAAEIHRAMRHESRCSHRFGNRETNG